MPDVELQDLVVAQTDSVFALVLLFLAISLFFHMGKGGFILCHYILEVFNLCVFVCLLALFIVRELEFKG